MSTRPVVLRGRARRDFDNAVEHYLEEAGPVLAEDFTDAVEETLRHVGESPATGSPRYARELDIPGLRFRMTGKFPYLVPYVEKDSVVEVWRILHGSREIPTRMREPGED